jgi:CheY-like chemotaxis protein
VGRLFRARLGRGLLSHDVSDVARRIVSKVIACQCRNARTAPACLDYDGSMISTAAATDTTVGTVVAPSQHVLAVDDDPSIREVIEAYLGQHDFRVSSVADGRAMQAVLAHDVVDLVVLDLKLQAEDGMTLARRLRDESAIPIIMVSGRLEEADRVMGLELAADDYLTKPFSPRELLARIRAVLRRRRPRCSRAGRRASGPIVSMGGS